MGITHTCEDARLVLCCLTALPITLMQGCRDVLVHSLLLLTADQALQQVSRHTAKTHSVMLPFHTQAISCCISLPTHHARPATKTTAILTPSCCCAPCLALLAPHATRVLCLWVPFAVLTYARLSPTCDSSGCSGASTMYVAPNRVSGRVVYTVRVSSADRLLPAGGVTLKVISAPCKCAATPSL